MKNKFWLIALFGLLLSLIFADDVFAQSTISGTFEDEMSSATFINNEALIHVKGFPLTSFNTFTVSGNKITLRRAYDNVETWTIIDENTIRDNNGNTLNRIKTISGRFYGQRTSHELIGNIYVGYFNTTPLFKGTFTVSGSTINVNGTDIDGKTSRFSLIIIDSSTISDGDNFYRKR